MKSTLRKILLGLFILAGSLSSYAYDEFRVVNGIPHLPVFADTTAIASPAAGMLIYDEYFAMAMIYTGNRWEDLCTHDIATANDGYFKVVDGIPIMGIVTAVPSDPLDGAVTASTISNKLWVYEAGTTSWKGLDLATADPAEKASFSAKTGSQFPVLSADPTGVQKGAIYYNKSSKELKVYTGSAWNSYNCGFTTTWQTASASESIEISAGDLGAYDAIIDWGDGNTSVITAYDDADLTHTYASAGTYNVTIRGKFPHLLLNNSSTKEKLIAIVRWGNVGFESFNNSFSGCTNLVSLPNGHIIMGANKVTDASYMFAGCTSLASIDVQMFKSMHSVESFSWIFSSCTALTTIPAGLFDANTQVTAMDHVFVYCSGVTSIPAGLFDNNTKVTTFQGAFYDNNLTGATAVPSGLFDNNTEVTNFRGTLGVNVNLTSIPSGLFDNNTKVTNFHRTFTGNAGLTSIPAGLFTNNTLVTDFEGTFEGCTALTGTADDIWNTYSSASGTDCFIACSGLDNYNDVPHDWGGPAEFATEWNMPSGSFTLPTEASASYSCTIDWGDGSPTSTITAWNDADLTHTYASGGTYTIKITGTFGHFFMNNNATIKDRLTKVLSWGNPDFSSVSNAFWGCSNLSSIPNSPIPAGTATNAVSLFSECTSLDEIYGITFSQMTNVTNFIAALQACTSLMSIPSGLFDANTLVTDFSSVFLNCSSITAIPAGLFDKNTEVTTFLRAFESTGLNSAIPDNLFDKNTKVTAFQGTFWNTGITGIPADLFRYNTLVTNFWGTFGECPDLTSIPAGLFDYNTAATSFKSTFYNNTSLTSIPTGLFTNNTAATNFEGTFRECTSITSISAGLFNNNTEVTTFESVFLNCNAITAIPANLFDNNTKVKNMQAVFSGTSISSIPSDIFDFNTEVEYFNGVFSNCTSISSIPSGLFDENTKAIELNFIFYGCTSLTTIPAGLFDNNTDVTTITRAFVGCTSLTSIPVGLFDNNTQIAHFYETFLNCTSLSGAAPALWSSHSTANGLSCFRNCTGLSNYGSIPSTWK